MKKSIVAACILTIVLFVFPLSSFAKGGKGGCVVPFKGNIEDLVFDFGDGFVLELGDLGEVTVLEVIVYAGGRETTVVTPKKKYIYNNSLSVGWEWGLEDKALVPQPVNGKRIIYAFTEEFGDEWPLVFEFESATLFEHFKIDKRQIDAACEGSEVRVPKKVDLFFEVKQAILIDEFGDPVVGDDDNPLIGPFNFILEIIDGKPVHSEVW
jgi:hypothetical protein